MFIVEIDTTTGRVCETFPTYEEARRRIDQFPAAGLVGIPLLFQELPDGSQRLVREDGKPLQVHRLPEDRPAGPDEPLPLCDPLPAGATPRDEDDEPLPLCDDLPLPPGLQ